jgi:CheY-like chemotaxis protein
MPYNKYILDKSLHVFIADDDIDDVDFFKSALADIAKHIKITVASNGDELMEFLQITTPDLIFLDINMPCKNGIDCLSEIRALKKFDRTPIIMYSTTANDHHIDKTYELGANLYFEKTVSYEAIKEHLRDILSHSPNELLPKFPRDKFVIRA